MSNQSKYMMGEDRIPHAWYNIMADLPSPPPPPLHPGTGPADRAGRSRAALSDGADRPGGEPGAAHRNSRARPRHLSHVAPDAAPSRARAREGARDDGAHLLQERGREPGRQPQAQHRRRPGLLQQAGRRDQALDRDRRGAVGLLARLRRRAVRPRSQGLHGQGLLQPEALPAGADGDLRREMRRKPEQRDRIRPRHPRPRTRIRPAASASPSRRRSRSRPRTPTRSTRWAAC